jgi:hypothetical protein
VPLLDLAVIAGAQQAQDEHAAWFRACG